MNAFDLLTRLGGNLTREEEFQLTRELADAYHMDEASSTSREVQRIAEIVRARLQESEDHWSANTIGPACP
jgi:hypothetical protein